MESYPKSGTDAALHATFRLILGEPSSSKLSSFNDFIGKSVILEPIDFPGMQIAQQEDGELVVTNLPIDGGSSIFHLIAGLDGKPGTVSLESKSQEGCYVYSGANIKSGTNMKLGCSKESSGAGFNQAVSYVMEGGISQYHPISFVAKGVKRNFLLAPLLSHRDEYYTVYFNIQA